MSRRPESFSAHVASIAQAICDYRLTPVMSLLAAEITARTDKDPAEHYRDLTAEFGAHFEPRGETIVRKLTRAPGNDAPIGGLKVTTRGGGFAARPSGTGNAQKIYRESCDSGKHLKRIFDEAQNIVNEAVR